MKKVVFIAIVVMLCSVFVFLLFQVQTHDTAHSATESLSQTTQSVVSKTDAQSTIDTSQIVTVDLDTSKGNQKIKGVVTAPKGYEQAKLPTLIFAHGFNNTYYYSDFLAEQLARQGYIVYRFDFINGSHNGQSGNNMLEMSIFTEQADLEQVLNMVNQQPFVDTQQVYLLGMSQGGVVATMTAIAHQDAIKGLILLYPAFVMFDDAKNLFSSVDEIPAVYNHRGTNLGKVYFENLLDYDIYQQMSQFNKPVLLIHGTNDTVVPLVYAQRASETFSQAKLYILDGATHIFNRENNQQAASLITNFLQNQQ